MCKTTKINDRPWLGLIYNHIFPLYFWREAVAMESKITALDVMSPFQSFTFPGSWGPWRRSSALRSGKPWRSFPWRPCGSKHLKYKQKRKSVGDNSLGNLFANFNGKYQAYRSSTHGSDSRKKYSSYGILESLRKQRICELNCCVRWHTLGLGWRLKTSKTLMNIKAFCKHHFEQFSVSFFTAIYFLSKLKCFGWNKMFNPRLCMKYCLRR